MVGEHFQCQFLKQCQPYKTNESWTGMIKWVRWIWCGCQPNEQDKTTTKSIALCYHNDISIKFY